MSETEAKEAQPLKTPPPFQRFQRIIGRGLAVGLESNVSKDEVADHQLGDDYKVDSRPQATHIRHSAETNGADLFSQLLLNPDSAETLRIVFKTLPVGLMANYQKLNIRQRVDDKVLGIAYGRFPVPGVAEEKEAFYGNENPETGERYFNPDCLSMSPVWNPLFVKYHLSVVPSLKQNEFGYVRIDVSRDENRNIVVAVSRAQESEVPDILKTAKTLPR